MDSLQADYEVSERRACRVVGQHRSVQRYTPVSRDKNRPLVEKMHQLAGDHPRYGYRRIHALLRREGFRVNRKKVQRLWREAGLQVPQKQCKKRRLGSSDNACDRHRPEAVNHVWCYDFVSDQTEDGRTLKMLTVVDEYTRECLAIVVARSIKGKDVVNTLDALIDERGAPGHIRSDNGPEFIAGAVRDYLDDCRVGPLYIEPGAPWENGYSESFNGSFGDELLKRELFINLKEAEVIVEDYRIRYNTKRPHSSLGYLTPIEYAEQARQSGRVYRQQPLGLS